jgi:hypothetical protein
MFGVYYEAYITANETGLQKLSECTKIVFSIEGPIYCQENGGLKG